MVSQPRSSDTDWTDITDLDDLISGDEARAEAAIARIASLPDEGARALYAPLVEALSAPEAERRWWAVRALAAVPVAEATQALAQALADRNPAVRQCAALGLRERPDAAAIPALAQALADSDPLVSRLAGDALAAVGNEATPALLEAFQKGSPTARLAAARALAAVGDPRSIPALFAALDDESQLIVHWVNEALERMGVGMSFFSPE